MFLLILTFNSLDYDLTPLAILSNLSIRPTRAPPYQSATKKTILFESSQFCSVLLRKQYCHRVISTLKLKRKERLMKMKITYDNFKTNLGVFISQNFTKQHKINNFSFNFSSHKHQIKYINTSLFFSFLHKTWSYMFVGWPCGL